MADQPDVVPDLPIDLVREIIGRVEFSADACVQMRKHGALPKKLVVDKELIKELDAICIRRKQRWESYLKYKNNPQITPCFEHVRSKNIPSGVRKEKYGTIDYIYINGNLMMQFEMLETTYPNPNDPWAHLGAEVEELRILCCNVHTGETCQRLIGISD
jgi:hypothetical protein